MKPEVCSQFVTFYSLAYVGRKWPPVVPVEPRPLISFWLFTHPPALPRRRAVGYARIAAEGSEGSLAIQRSEIARFAELRGLELIAEFHDRGVSGNRDPHDRPGLAAAIAACRALDAVLVVADITRLARSREVLTAIRGLGVKFAVAEQCEAVAEERERPGLDSREREVSR